MQERFERLELAQQQKLILTRRHRVNSLFEVWDNDGSGYLELEELQLVLGRWKGFNSEQAQEHGEPSHRRVYLLYIFIYCCVKYRTYPLSRTLYIVHSAREILVSLGASRLSRGAFQLYIEGLTEDMDLAEFEEFAEFLLTSVKVGCWSFQGSFFTIQL